MTNLTLLAKLLKYILQNLLVYGKIDAQTRNHLPIKLFSVLFLTIFICHYQHTIAKCEYSVYDSIHSVYIFSFTFTMLPQYYNHLTPSKQHYTKHAIQKQKQTQISLEIQYTVAVVHINPLQSPHIAISTRTDVYAVLGLIDWKFFTRVSCLSGVYITHCLRILNVIENSEYTQKHHTTDRWQTVPHLNLYALLYSTSQTNICNIHIYT